MARKNAQIDKHERERSSNENKCICHAFSRHGINVNRLADPFYTIQ